MIAPINPKSAPKCQDAREHTHLFMAGYDDTVPQRAHCDALVEPPFRPRHGGPDSDLCVVCLAISAWSRDASDNDYEEWLQSRRSDTAY